MAKENATTRTVLIADDVAFVRQTLTQVLSEARYRVVGEASTGREAMDLYEKLKPDLVTMDVVMPEMSGIEATRKIIEKNPSAKIVMVSAMGNENLIIEAIHAGAKDYVLKPFRSEELLQVLERVCNGEEGESDGAELSG